ncbi:MAG: phage Gp37/Gp68 family protein [Desulfobacterales bacterium]
MSYNSAIEWTESTWNPTTGCTKISEGCNNCYAERMSRRLKAMGQNNYRNGFKLTPHDSALEIPLLWKKPQLIFVDSMSDLFHEDVPVEFIYKVFKTMHKADWHIFQILTKRPERLAKLDKTLKWSDNIWMGVTVENNDYINRINVLKNISSKIKFISFEPLLGPIKFNKYDRIDWIIVGGESGPGARKIEKDWVIDIRNNCIENRIPFFFKQWGGFAKKKNGYMLDRKIWREMPSAFHEFVNRDP